MKTHPNLQWIIVAGLGCVCVASWSTVCVGLFVRFSIRTWTWIVTAAAISTEMLLWAVACALGVTVIQTRRRLWDWVGKSFRIHR
jgi:hypothetical protein